MVVHDGDTGRGAAIKIMIADKYGSSADFI